MSGIQRELDNLTREERELLELLLAKQGVDLASLPIPRRADEAGAPLSFSQERFWFLDQLERASQAYNVPLVFRVKGRLDTGVLEQSLAGLISRHEALRTTFPVVDGRAVQRVKSDVDFRLRIIEPTQTDPALRESEALELAENEARRGFNPAEETLLRATLIRLTATDHILALVTHHFAADGWSVYLLLRELDALYLAGIRGEQPSLPMPGVQYADYAAWQRNLIQGKTLQSRLDYWRGKLDGAASVLQLPSDRPRPPMQTFRGATRRFTVSRELTDSLRLLSRKNEATMFMTLLAAFKVLLYRYTAQRDITVGTAVSERSRPEVERVIGPFSNSVLLRSRIRGETPFSEFLSEVRETALEAYEHQDVPFEKLVEELKPPRDLSRNPLFQVMFVLHQNPVDRGFQLADLQVSRVDIELGTARLDVSVDIVDGDELAGYVEYNSDLFDAATMDRMIGHYLTILEGIVSSPHDAMADLPILTPDETHYVLEEVNATDREFPRDQAIHHLFEEQARRTPMAIAAIRDESSITYVELNERANQLAHYLRLLGVGPETRVAIALDRTFDLLVGILGILKAGGAYVPIDPAYPAERRTFMLADANAPILITREGLETDGGGPSCRIVLLDSHRDLMARESRRNPIHTTNGDNLAYVIYTSGSTGVPKGVAIEHRSAVNLLHWTRDVFSDDEISRVLASTSVCFDLSVFEIFTPLSRGGTVVLVDNVLSLAELPESHGVTLVNSVPSGLAELAEMGAIPASVRTINLAGEPLSSALVDRLYGRATVERVYDLYGPSETTTYSTFALRGKGGPATIGRPVANTRIYVLDSRMRPVPIGVAGEIFIGGEGVSRGYLNQPAKTRERFVDSPFANGGQERLYRTGDTGRYRADGALEYLGRVDRQVKLRGYRIEPGEIEAALRRHPGVREAIVMVREDVKGDRRLTAYLAGNGNEAAETGEIRRFLRQRLPEHMVPDFLIPLDELPLTPNGKVDRSALPAPERGRGDEPVSFVAPRNEVELRLCRMFEKLLGVRPVGIRDSFFDLNGHSLLAVQLFAGIERAFGKNLPLATLFQAPTVEELASILQREGWTPTWSSLVPIQPGGSRPPIFCVHAFGGNVLYYRDLARRLGDDQPFYGLQAQGLDGKRPRHTRIEEMAEHYISEIKAFYPDGPFYVAGDSFGGSVAYEMACQLVEQGQKVGLLVLFDTYGPGYPRYKPGTSNFRIFVNESIQRVWHHIGSIWMLPGGERLPYIRHKLKKTRKAIIRVFLSQRKRITRRFRSKEDTLPKAILDVQRAIRDSVLHYQPRPYSGKVTLFRASEQPLRIIPDPTLGWADYAQGGLEIHEVVGSHGALVVEPRVRFMVDKLRECLDRAYSEERGEKAS